MSDSTKPRAMTAGECREKFLRHAAHMALYWSNLPGHTPESRVDGAVFSILVALDGGAMALPGFRVLPDPHPSDAATSEAEGENWWSVDVDIAGGLHELFHDVLKAVKAEGDLAQLAGDRLPPDAGSWRTMKSAPKDGSPVLVATHLVNGEAHVAVARYDSDRQARRPKPFWSRESCFGVRWDRENPPHHWQPLPKAPPTPAGPSPGRLL